MVTEKEPEALREIAPVLRDRRDVVLQRIASQEAMLRDNFAELETLDYRRTFDECVVLAKKALEHACTCDRQPYAASYTEGQLLAAQRLTRTSRGSDSLI